MTGNTIWDLAIKHANCNEKLSKHSNESVLLVIGSKNSGKTSICYKFVEKNDVPKTTLALEYSFARRSRNVDLEKDVCHIWELGGGTIFKELLEIPITASSILFLKVVLVLDLSLPEELWFTMQSLLSAVRKRIESVVSQCKDLELKKQLQQQIKARVQSAEEKGLMEPFPVALFIVGSKYDLFQEIESEKRKLICKCLRYLALTNAATLQFVTIRAENLMNKMRVSLSHMVFGTASSKTHILDYNKPLYVPYGIDSAQDIGTLPDLENASISLKVQSLSAVTQCFLSFYPQVEEQNILPSDPGSDQNFAEPEIDRLKAEKAEEIENYKKKMQQGQRRSWE